MKKLIFYGVMLFMAGIILSAFIGEKVFIRIPYFQRYRYEMFATSKVGISKVFWKILWERGKIYAFLLLFSMTRYKKHLPKILFGIGIALLGMLFGAYTICFGARGILLCFIVLFPHILLYFFSLLLLCKERRGSLLFWVLGIVAETIIGTSLLILIIRVLFL